MIRILAFALAVYLGYRGLKAIGVIPSRRADPGDFGAQDNASVDADLVKDPQCGVYFLKQSGVQAKVGNRTIYFCSRKCLENYMSGRSSGSNAAPFHEES